MVLGGYRGWRVFTSYHSSQNGVASNSVMLLGPLPPLAITSSRQVRIPMP